MIKVTEIAFTGYPVTDIARARGFYEEVLGLKPARNFVADGASWIEYDVGPSTLAVTNMKPDWKPASGGPSVTLEVEDFDAAIATVRAAKVKFLVEPFNSPVCRLCVVLDPDGNSLALHKRNTH